LTRFTLRRYCAGGPCEDLATNVAHPVRRYDTLEVLRELRATLFLKMAPGHVSTQLVAQGLPGMRSGSIADRGPRYAAVVAAREDGADFPSPVH
jgi:hypothetical protein